jgi:Zn-dependent protease with chaperone function
MRRLLRLLLMVLALPVIGVVVVSVARAYFDTQFVREMEGRLAPGDPVRNHLGSLREFCAAAGDIRYGSCDADARYRWRTIASAATGGFGLLLLVAITVAGKLAEGDRRRLLAVFRPGLYVTALTATVLIVVHALLALALLMDTMRMPGFVLLAILGGAASGVMAVGRSLFGAARPIELYAFGGRIGRDQAPELWRHVEAAAARLGALPPDEIVAGLDANFFVTEAEVTTPNGPCRGRTLFCSLPLARILTVDEFMAIVGHELGHFRGEDTVMSQRFYPIYRGATEALDGLAESGGGARGVALAPAAAILGFFLDRFATAERRHSRERELVADRAGVEATSVRAMAVALVKTHAFADLWPEVAEQLAATRTREHRADRTGSILFAAAAARAATPQALEGIAEIATTHPTDTHPALGERLESLGVRLSDVSIDALHVAPHEPAIALVPTADSHEQALGRILSESWAGRGLFEGRD